MQHENHFVAEYRKGDQTLSYVIRSNVDQPTSGRRRLSIMRKMSDKSLPQIGTCLVDASEDDAEALEGQIKGHLDKVPENNGFRGIVTAVKHMK